MNIKKGTKVGALWGLGLALVCTIPMLFMPLGDPVRGADLVALAKADRRHLDFWLDRGFSFCVMFAVGFVVASLIGSSRPEKKTKQYNPTTV